MYTYQERGEQRAAAERRVANINSVHTDISSDCETTGANTHTYRRKKKERK